MMLLVITVCVHSFLHRQANFGAFKLEQGCFNNNRVAGRAMQTCFSCQRLWCQHIGSACMHFIAGAWKV